MGQADTPWGAEDIVLNTDISMEKNHGNLVLKRIMLDAEELTPVTRNLKTNTVLYVLHGSIDIKVGDEFYELEDSEGHFIEAGTPYQVENLDDDVTAVLKIMFPYDPDDVEVLDNPYEQS